MNRETLYYLIEEKINDIFVKYQESNNIESGDITPEQDLRLENIQNQLADLIMDVGIENKITGIIEDTVGSKYAKNILSQRDDITENTFMEDVKSHLFTNPEGKESYFDGDIIKTAIGEEFAARLGTED